MCLAQGPQRSDDGEARGPSVLSQALYNCTPFLTLGVRLGAPGFPGGQNIIFSNMVMWHIRLTGIMSRTEYRGGLELAILRVLGVRQNSHLNK